MYRIVSVAGFGMNGKAVFPYLANVVLLTQHPNSEVNIGKHL